MQEDRSLPPHFTGFNRVVDYELRRTQEVLRRVEA